MAKRERAVALPAAQRAFDDQAEMLARGLEPKGQDLLVGLGIVGRLGFLHRGILEHDGLVTGVLPLHLRGGGVVGDELGGLANPEGWDGALLIPLVGVGVVDVEVHDQVCSHEAGLAAPSAV